MVKTTVTAVPVTWDVNKGESLSADITLFQNVNFCRASPEAVEHTRDFFSSTPPTMGYMYYYLATTEALPQPRAQNDELMHGGNGTVEEPTESLAHGTRRIQHIPSQRSHPSPAHGSQVGDCR